MRALRSMRCCTAVTLAVFSTCCCTNAVFAGDSKNRQTLEAVKADITETHNQHALTSAKIRRIEDDILAKRQTILSQAASIRKQEQEALALEKNIESLRQETARKQRDIADYRDHMSRMVSAAWSMQYRPQLAAWLLPDDTRERALAARGLQMTSLSLKESMEQLNMSLSQLEAMRQEIITTQETHREAQQILEEERRALQDVVKQQQQLRSTLRRDNEKRRDKIAALTKRARSLQKLIGGLEEARDTLPELPDDTAPDGRVYRSNTAFDARANTAFMASKGALPLPAEGTITGIFGERRGENDRLKGIELQTSKGAIIAAPYQGEVLFTGPFMDYGNMVILRHSREYHTLVAGLSRIDVTPGQFLLDGEPIGAMGYDITQRNLYLELRKSSEAIDPKPWFALKKKAYATR